MENAISLGDLPTQNVDSNGLLAVNTEEDIVVSSTPDYPYPTAVNPYVNQAPIAILEREYNAGEYDFTRTTAEQFTVIPPPMFDQDAVRAALSTFKYIRWKKIRWRIQGLCSPFTYGWFGASCIPINLPQRGTALSLDFGLMSHSDAVIVDMSSAAEILIETPWLFNTEWLDLDRLSDTVNVDVADNLARLNALKLFYLFQSMDSLNSTVVPSYTGSIFCKFEGVEVAGPCIYRYPPAPLALKSKSIHYRPKVKERKHPELQAFGAAAAFAGGLASEHVVPEITKFAKQNLGAYTQAGLKQASDWVSSFLSDTEAPVGAPLTNESSSESSNVIPNVFGSMNISPPVNIIGQGMGICSKPVFKHSILREIMKPSLLTYFSYGSTDNRVQFIPHPFYNALHPTSTDATILRSCSRIRFFGSMHRFWKGSVNYTFVMISSPLVTWKMKFMTSYQTPDITEAEIGDTASDVVTIKGSTIHTITVPYLYSNPWSQTTNSGYTQDSTSFNECVPTIVIQKLNVPIASGDRPPSLYILVYESACDDFEYSCPRESRPNSSTPVELQMRVSSFNKERAPAQGHSYKSVFSTDQVSTVEDFCKKWSVRSDQLLTGPDPLTQSIASSYFDFSVLDALSTLFFYWRGQIKFKIQTKPDPTVVISESTALVVKMDDGNYSGPAPAVPDGERFADGSHAVSAGLTQVLTFTRPYMCNSEFLPVIIGTGYSYIGSAGSYQYDFDAHLYTVGATSSLPLAWVAVAAGDDLSFAYAMPPPWAEFRWYDASYGSLSIPMSLRSEIKSAELKRCNVVRPRSVVSETRKLLRQELPKGIRLHISGDEVTPP